MQENQTSTKRYSYRREVIYDTLKATTAHPDVDAIYAAVREKLPGVGVATVYRVLRDLVAEGKAVTLETTDDRIHYDADVSPHAHFICGKCGRIIDIFETPALTEKAEKMGFTVKSEKTVLYGICPDCAAKKQILTVCGGEK